MNAFLRRLPPRALFTIAIIGLVPAAHSDVPAGAAAIDLAGATLLLPSGMSGPEKKAAEMLLDESEKRSQVRWPVSDRAPDRKLPAVYLGRRSELRRSFPALAARLTDSADSARPEGYEMLTLGTDTVVVAGNDERGVLFGAGRLLRTLDYGRGTLSIPAGLDVASAPRYGLRGHQLGYRPKTNSYDGWTVAMWEQYIRDLVVFGANAIELIPPRSDDAADSPHFPLPQMRMMVEMSRLAAEYGLECWVWYPALDDDYSNDATVAQAVEEWSAVLGRLPRIDAVFVPGGDPGRTPPKLLFALMEKQAARLKQTHPQAKWWVSPQGFGQEWMDEFYRLLGPEPKWLHGVVFGPQQRESLEELRAHVPARYPIRFYPDITHTQRSQYPVPDWDYAYAVTLQREPIDPRPRDEAAIFHRLQPLAACGFLTYSEGCNDDVNKCVWSGLGWDPSADVTDILREYSRYFIGTDQAESFAQALLALERNWRGPLATNQGVFTTLAQLQDLERSATPALLHNWRFQQALYRAYYDATTRSRLLVETVQENRAMEALRRAPQIGTEAAMAAAEAALARPAVPPAADWRARTFELAEALFQSIHMQLSVTRYQAIDVGRGANLDLIDFPLNDAPWLRRQFAGIRALATEKERLARLREIVNWSDPGPGGFYDDLGNPAAQPHLVDSGSYADDPASLKSPMTGVGVEWSHHDRRVSSCTFAETLTEQPLEMHYPQLDRTAHYRVRVVYNPEAMGRKREPALIRLVANGSVEIHPFLAKREDLRPLEFDLPQAVTAGGDLRLTWSRPPGLGGNGRGVQVAEVWLIRLADAAGKSDTP